MYVECISLMKSSTHELVQLEGETCSKCFYTDICIFVWLKLILLKMPLNTAVSYHALREVPTRKGPTVRIYFNVVPAWTCPCWIKRGQSLLCVPRLQDYPKMYLHTQGTMCPLGFSSFFCVEHCQPLWLIVGNRFLKNLSHVRSQLGIPVLRRN